MQVEQINSLNIKKAKEFISKVPMLKELGDEIFEKMLVLVEGESIYGMVSYETYGRNALIRYFIFQRNVNHEDLKKLIEQMIIRTKQDKLNMVISVVDQVELIDFFESLGFIQFEKENIYIDETPISDIVGNVLGLVYCLS